MVTGLAEKISRASRTAFAAGCVGLLACGVGYFMDRAQFFQSWLTGYVFWFGMGIGCLGLLMLHHVVGGAWGNLLRPLLEAGSSTLPKLAVLFLPLLAGLSVLYPWARPEQVAADHVLQHKQMYLNGPFFLLRAAVFFGFWSFLANRLNRWSDRRDDAAVRKGRNLSAPGLFFFVLTFSFAMVDWVMSIEPHWQSSLFGAMVLVGQVLGTIALLIVALNGVSEQGETAEKPVHDLGNLLMAFVLVWAYLSFSQYLIMWYANMPEEISWYLHRQTGGWMILALGLAGVGFFLPFLILLDRTNKRRVHRLAKVAGLILVLRAADVVWLIVPSFHPHGFHVHWLDAAAFVAVGGIWIGFWLAAVNRRGSAVGAP
jgi:hypothetical protein